MAFTAYPDDVGENPNIVASNDGQTWVVPAGLTNPIDPLPGDPPMVNGSRFNADTDLAYHDGTLYAFWRLYDALGTPKYRIWVRTSTDGVTWTPRQVVLDSQDDNLTSPFFLVDESGLWHLWYGGGAVNGKRSIRHSTAPAVTGPWSPAVDCTVNGLEDWRHWWHFDAIRVGEPGGDGYYIGLFTSTKAGTTNLSGVLYATVSRDGLTWSTSRAIIGAPNPAPGWPRTWDSTIIYRCSGALDGQTLRVWYATAQKIGYTEVPLDVIKAGLDQLRYGA